MARESDRDRNRMFYSIIWCSLLLLMRSVALIFIINLCFVLPVTFSDTVQAGQSINESKVDKSEGPNSPGIVSIKLFPRHTELERRRQRDRKLIQLENDSAIEDEDGERRRNEAVQVGALFEGYGTHYVDLWCGSPPQRQTVIVDTGSGITAFPCSGCNDCGVPSYHIDRLFVEAESSTFETATCSSSADCVLARSGCQGNSCKVSMAYAEGSRWNAYEGVDYCYVAGMHETPLVSSQDSTMNGDDLNPRHAADLAFNMAFGCQTLVTGLFKTQLADGIMGMSNQPSTYWSQMFKAGKMGPDRQFALCFSRPPTITREGTEAGALTFGGVDNRLHLSPMVFTPAASGGRASFFSVKIRRMMLRDGQYGESALSNDSNPNKGVKILDIDEGTLNRGGAIVDSGTTDTYWNRAIAGEFQRVFTELSGREHNNKPMNLSDEEFNKLPTILLQLYSDDDTNAHIDDMFHTAGLAGALDKKHKSDVILAIPASHYMEYSPEKDTYTSRFYPTESSGSVLGANAMMGHDVHFDIDNNRIGWAESDCDYTATLKEHGYEFDITGNLKSDVEESGSSSEVAHAECESYKSGSKCPTNDGCAWYWGKCTKSSEAPPETPAPTNSPVESDNSSPADDEDYYYYYYDKPSGSEEVMSNDTITIVSSLLDGNKAVGVGIAVGLILTCCLFYCCCCRNRNAVKYTRASLEPISIEMTIGADSMVPIDGHMDSFSDEPPVKIDGGDALSAQTALSSKFRDRTEEKPEFEGDYA